MLGGFTYFVNVSCSCAASISSVLLSSPKKEHQLNLSAETLTMLFPLIHIEAAGLWIVISLPFFSLQSMFFPWSALAPASQKEKVEAHIDQRSIGLDYQTSLLSIFPCLS